MGQGGHGCFSDRFCLDTAGRLAIGDEDAHGGPGLVEMLDRSLKRFVVFIEANMSNTVVE
jgi:hypothetical protein